MVHPLTTAAEQDTDSTTTAGAANAAQIDLGDVSTKVDVFVDVSGAATLTVEVSPTGAFGGEEKQASTTDYGSASTDFQQFDFAYEYVRAYVDANLNDLEVVGRGV